MGGIKRPSVGTRAEGDRGGRPTTANFRPAGRKGDLADRVLPREDGVRGPARLLQKATAEEEDYSSSRRGGGMPKLQTSKM